MLSPKGFSWTTAGLVCGVLWLTALFGAGSAHAAGFAPVPAPERVVEYPAGCRFPDGPVSFNIGDLDQHTRWAVTSAKLHLSRTTDFELRAGKKVQTPNRITTYNSPKSSVAGLSYWNRGTCSVVGVQNCDIYLNEARIAGKSIAFKRQLILHELGHCMGMAHSRNTHHAMYHTMLVPLHYSGGYFTDTERRWINRNY